jgi:hypothetical protein
MQCIFIFPYPLARNTDVKLLVTFHCLIFVIPAFTTFATEPVSNGRPKLILDTDSANEIDDMYRTSTLDVLDKHPS